MDIIKHLFLPFSHGVFFQFFLCVRFNDFYPYFHNYEFNPYLFLHKKTLIREKKTLEQNRLFSKHGVRITYSYTVFQNQQTFLRIESYKGLRALIGWRDFLSGSLIGARLLSGFHSVKNLSSGTFPFLFLFLLSTFPRYFIAF